MKFGNNHNHITFMRYDLNVFKDMGKINSRRRKGGKE